MISWSKLPAEILLNIFDLLPENSKTQCQLTCKKWAVPAQMRLYQSIAIGKERDWINFEKLMTTITTSTDNPGKFVKEINLCPPEDYPSKWENAMELGVLEMFAKYCPNVQQLLSSEFNMSFWFTLLALLNEGCWKRIKEIPDPMSTIWLREYMYVAKAACGSLEKMTLRDFKTEDCEGLGNFLVDFKNLKELTMVIYTSCDFFRYDEMFNQVTTLKKLQLVFFHEQSKSESFDQTWRSVPILSMVKQNLTMKDLSLNIEINDDNTLEYIMHRYPRLSKLELGPGAGHSIPVIKGPSVNVLKKFMSYLVNLREFYVNKIYVSDTNASTVTLFTKALLKYGYELHLKIQYLENIRKEEREREEYSTFGCHFLIHKFSYEKKFHLHISIDRYAENTASAQPHYQLINTAPASTKELTLDVECAERPLKLRLMYSCFEPIFDKRFSSLKVLNIVNSFVTIYVNEQSTNDTVEEIKFRDCTIDLNATGTISKRFKSLKRLTIQYCNFQALRAKEDILRNITDNLQTTTIEMRETTFEFINCKRLYKCIHHARNIFCLHITCRTTAIRDLYLVMDKRFNAMKRVNSKNFYAICNENRADCSYFHIDCKSIDTFYCPKLNISEPMGKINIKELMMVPW